MKPMSDDERWRQTSYALASVVRNMARDLKRDDESVLAELNTRARQYFAQQVDLAVIRPIDDLDAWATSLAEDLAAFKD